MLLILALILASELELGYNPSPGPSEKPALIVTPPRAVSELVVSCEAGGKTYDWTKTNLPGGKAVRFEWPRGPSTADCYIRARFADGMVEEMQIPLEFTFSGPLSVDLSKAQADVENHTLTVSVSGHVSSAEIVAYGPKKVVLERREISLDAGPGKVTSPWAGDAGEVVLLEVTLREGGSWAKFEFSPWYLDIPHEDVLFDTNSDVIASGEEYKLQRTLEQLHDVVDKYGDVVPINVYIGGCTDTVGDSAHNADLSRRRAKAIAVWLRNHGFDKPIYYHGFGESYLAVQTGDGVDEARNRRAVYMVGSSPPPSGSGVPGASWVKL